MAAKKKAVAKKDQLPAKVVNLAADAGMGLEGANKDSFAIPYLGILQQLSPQVDSDDEAYVKGAKPGKMFNSVSGEVYDGVVVLPVAYKMEILEWIPRSEGGGLVGRYEVGDEPAYKIVDGRWKTEDGHDLSDTRMHYVLILKKDGSFEPAVISMASSQIKKSKRWMTMMQNFKVTQAGQTFTPPTFVVKYEMGSIKEENDKGKWHGWTIKNLGVLTEDEMNLYAASKEFHSAIIGGRVTTADPAPEAEADDNF